MRSYTDGVHRFSASRIKMYQDCGLQAYFRYVERAQAPLSAAAAFGKIVHRALEHYQVAENLDESLDIFVELWDDPPQGLRPDFYHDRTSWQYYRELGISTIKGFHENQAWDAREVMSAEHRFLVPMGEFWLTGAVDLVEIKKSGTGKPMVRIIDYKTAGKQPTKAELALDVQLTCYLWAVQQKEFWLGVDGDPEFPAMPNGEEMWEKSQKLEHRAIWYHVRTSKELDAGPRDDADFMRLYRVMKEIDKAVRANIHMPKIGQCCAMCDYRTYCPLDIPETLVVDSDDESAWI